MPVTHPLKNFEFRISDFGFPPTLPCQWGVWAGIENSKFKIENFPLIDEGWHQRGGLPAELH